MRETMPLEIERKYLIRRPAPAVLAALPEVRATEMTQTYLSAGDDGFNCRRVRKRGSDAQGWEYTYTCKKHVGFGERIELEDTISEAVYSALLNEADPAKHPISKVRYVFFYKAQCFELDVYAFSTELATLEIELPSIDTPVELPPQIDVIRDVTGETGYSNFDLSDTLAFPE